MPFAKNIDHAKQSATDALKTSSRRVIQKRAKIPDDLIGYKNAKKIRQASRNSQQNNL